MLIYGLVGAATGSGIGYLIFDFDGAVGGGIFGGVTGLLTGAMLRVGATADKREAEAAPPKKKDDLEEATEQNPRAKRSDSLVLF